MKPLLVESCSHYDFNTNMCAKCERMMPDHCLEFEQMKQKADAYEQIHAESKDVEDTSTLVSDTVPTDSPMGTVKTQEDKKPRGRPRKVAE